eukprot:evm.model.scf_2653.2 EVM.evm.TU.scf_2653.2   scf_2653:15495-17567(+)
MFCRAAQGTPIAEEAEPPLPQTIEAAAATTEPLDTGAAQALAPAPAINQTVPAVAAPTPVTAATNKTTAPSLPPAVPFPTPPSDGDAPPLEDVRDPVLPLPPPRSPAPRAPLVPALRPLSPEEMIEANQELIRAALSAPGPRVKRMASQQLERGADPDACCVESGNIAGCAALHATGFQVENLGVAELLVQAGADVGLPCRDGWTPLHVAAASGSSAVIDLLIDWEADPDGRNDILETPLHWAADNNRVGAVRMLIKKGAGLDVEKIDGYTPLHIAALRGFVAVVAALEQAGADVEAEGLDGNKPRDVICNDAKVCSRADREALERLLA